MFVVSFFNSDEFASMNCDIHNFDEYVLLLGKFSSAQAKYIKMIRF